jgi:hypothetical protein
MHENREISCTPGSHDQGRCAKAINRTADMHVQEKSDCVVIPVNQSNKEERSSAETGEGRAQTEENIAQSRMRPTQSGKRMSQGLDGVRQAARARKQEHFTALLHHGTLAVSNRRAKLLPASLLVLFSEIIAGLAEFRRNTDNVVVVKVGFRRALEKCFKDFFRDRHGELPRFEGRLQTEWHADVGENDGLKVFFRQILSGGRGLTCILSATA